MKTNLRSILIAMLISLLLITGCDIQLYEPVEPVKEVKPVTIIEEPVIEEKPDEPYAYAPIVTNTELAAATSIDSIIASLTLKEKIAQLFIVDFYGMTKTYHEKMYSKAMDDFLRMYPVGGIIYFAENVETKEQVLLLNKALTTVSQIPLFISVDEEGGIVSRLGKANIGVTQLPDAVTLSTDNTSEEVYSLALNLGNELKSLGFNMDFAPILDINTNVENPVIGKRAFGDDAETVTEYALAFGKGLDEAGVIYSGKHFPGHGDTTTDSHTEQTMVSHDMKRLNNIELVPFKAAIEANIPTIMMGHIIAPNVTNDTLPASLSSKMIQDLLRDTLGFEGLVLTDSLRMKAITDFYPAEEVGVMLLQAGGDVILIPDDFELTYNGILSAVEKGTLTEERIDESLRRILTVKLNYGLITEIEP